jgi:hypothetical protein
MTAFNHLKNELSLEEIGEKTHTHDNQMEAPAVYTHKYLREKYSFTKLESNNALKSTIRYVSKRYRPSGNCLLNYFLDRVPFLKWIFKYEVKNSLLKDVIAGLTIGIVHIPQGMAYSLMAGLPPVYGLYVSFFPVLLYVFLGTSRHLSTGSFAITSLMTHSCIEKFEGKLYPSISLLKSMENSTTHIPNNTHLALGEYLSLDPVEAKIMISMALTFTAGIIQVL